MWRSLICLFALTVVLSVRDHAPDPRTTEREALAQLAQELDRATAADDFSGTVLIAKHGAPIFERAYGRADREQGIANTLDTSFNVGSMNKMLTAVATIRLVQEGKLAVTDTVGKWIPDYPNRAIADRVTIHHLLTHTGGTGDIFGPEYWKHRLKLRTHDDYIKLFGERDPLHAPGAEWQYSNYGFVLMGAILERVTGKSYYDAVAELVYTRAGMARTNAPTYDAPEGAIGYTRMRYSELEPNTWALPYRGTAAGGGHSTVGDFLKFANALTSYALLDESHTKLVTTGKVRTRHGFKYAYGFGDLVIDGVHCVGHNGGFPGVNGELLICDSGYTISILANFDPPAASKIAAFVIKRLPKS
jgi:CubicO group peptidase (beta-lactamase class C family)